MYKPKDPCPYCGNMYEPRSMTQHKRFCKSRPQETPSEPETDATPPDVTPETVTPTEVKPVTIPLSACPRELKYLPEGKLIFLNVAGRMKGGEFVLEDIKMRR
jgi:hypothetical protein